VSAAVIIKQMAAEVKKEIELEIAHVLFIDIVGYSKLLIDEQRDYLHTLNEVVRETDSFRAAEGAGKLTRLPTGDGMALVFATTPDAPVSCALQVSKALRSHPELRRRARACSSRATQYASRIDGGGPLGVGFERGCTAGAAALAGCCSLSVAARSGAAGGCGSSSAGAAASSGSASAGAGAAAVGAVGERQVSFALSTQPFTTLLVLST